MQAIIYVGHGSRVAKGNEQFIQFINKVEKRMTAPIQQIAFLEKAEPTLLDAIKTCVDKGATFITIVPVFLFSAGHVKIDLPEQVEKAKILYPHLTFSFTKPIGPDSKMINILLERLDDCTSPLSSVDSLADVSILLVGRGSSDLAQKRDFLKIRALLVENCPVQAVDYCFLAACEPNFIDGLNQAIKRSSHTVYVIPYLLFTGVLMKRMEKTIAEIRKRTNKHIVLTNYLGYHPKLVDIVTERVQQTILELA